MERKLVLVILAGAALARLASAQVSAPVLGYVADGGSLRAIQGIPAAAAVAGALSGGRDLALLEVAPAQNLALATAADNGELLLIAPSADGISASLSPVSGAAAGASRIVFSPGGNTAAAWFSSTGHLQILSGWTSSATVREVDASFLGGNPAALAVSDDAQWAVGAWPGGVYAFGPSGVITLPVQGMAQALAFFHGKSDLAVFTPLQVTTFTDIGGAATANVLWSNPSGAVDSAAPAAVGLAATFDNQFLSIAGSNGALFTFNLAGGTANSADCGCHPSGLVSLGGSLYRLTGATGAAMMLYDAATNEVWLVPLGISAGVGGQQ